MTGCESCHGPGRAHVEEGDPTKIMSFKNKSSKQISGNMSRLPLRQGRTQQLPSRRTLAQRYWLYRLSLRHSPETGRQVAASNVFVSSTNSQKAWHSESEATQNQANRNSVSVVTVRRSTSFYCPSQRYGGDGAAIVTIRTAGLE